MNIEQQKQWQVLRLSLEGLRENPSHDDILARAAECARRELTDIYGLAHTASFDDVIAAGQERQSFAKKISPAANARISSAIDEILGDDSRGHGVKVAQRPTGSAEL